jgi:hypothetical protein
MEARLILDLRFGGATFESPAQARAAPPATVAAGQSPKSRDARAAC